MASSPTSPDLCRHVGLTAFGRWVLCCRFSRGCEGELTMRRASLLAVLVALSALPGCGSLINLRDEKKVYGGARFDGLVTASEVQLIAGQVPPEKRPGYSMGIAMCWWAPLDLPLSIIGDTLTLPVTIPATIRKAKVGPAPASPSPSDDKKLQTPAAENEPEQPAPHPQESVAPST